MLKRREFQSVIRMSLPLNRVSTGRACRGLRKNSSSCVLFWIFLVNSFLLILEIQQNIIRVKEKEKLLCYFLAFPAMTTYRLIEGMLIYYIHWLPGPVSIFHLFYCIAGGGNRPTLSKSNYTDSSNLSWFLPVRFLQISWVSLYSHPSYRAAPTYLSKKYVKVFTIWLGLSLPKINLLDKLQCPSCQNDIFPTQMQPFDRVCFISSLASNPAAYRRTIFLSDSKNQSLCEGRWENKAFISQGTDFLLHLQELIPRAPLGVWLYSQSNCCAEKWMMFSGFVKNCLQWANTNFCLNSLMYPETRCEQGGATFFGEQPSHPLTMVRPLLPCTGCLHSLPAYPTPSPVFAFGTPSASTPHAVLFWYNQQSFSGQKSSPVLAPLELPAAFLIFWSLSLTGPSS